MEDPDYTSMKRILRGMSRQQIEDCLAGHYFATQFLTSSLPLGLPDNTVVGVAIPRFADGSEMERIKDNVNNFTRSIQQANQAFKKQ